MMHHPAVATLLDHIENKLVSDESVDIETHLRACGECLDKAVELRELVEFLASDAENEPPSEVLEWGIGLFQPILRPREGRSSRVRRIARRIFDSFEEPTPAGVRYAGGLPRQLLYRAGAVDIDLRIEPGTDGEHISLLGQVVSGSESAPQNTPVLLESSTGVYYDTLTNPVGEFSFDSVPKETYHLSVDLPEGEVTLFCVHRNAGAL